MWSTLAEGFYTERFTYKKDSQTGRIIWTEFTGRGIDGGSMYKKGNIHSWKLHIEKGQTIAHGRNYKLRAYTERGTW